MKVEQRVVVTDFGVVALPEFVCEWIDKPPAKKRLKIGGRVHKKTMKKRNEAAVNAVMTLSAAGFSSGASTKDIAKFIKAMGGHSGSA